MTDLARRTLAAIFLLAVAGPNLGMATESNVDREIRGVWVLDSVQEGTRSAHDPRWTLMMTFEEGPLFSVSSRHVTEVHQTGPKGATTRAVQHENRFIGKYRIVGDRLELTPAPPLSEDNAQFATVNFGPMSAPGRFSPGLALVGSLTLSNPKTGRQLLFRRHEKRIAP